MKNFAFGSMAVGLLLGLSVGSSQAANCQEILGNNLYRCQANSETSGPFEVCVQFFSPGTVSTKFDLMFGSAARYGCTCLAKGKVDAPDFGVSKEFLCADPIGTGSSQALRGKVSGNGNKIKGGFQVFSSGPAVMFACELDPACS